MPLRNGIPLKWQPRGLSDSADGTNAFPGAMQSLANLIPDPSMPYTWMARPPVLDISVFSAGEVISALLVIGDIAYGMVGDGGTQDQPFFINLTTGAGSNSFTGVTSGNKPTSQASTGAWTPPIMAQCGGRIIVTHPGFAGDTVKFGWIDISGFASSTVGDTTNTSPVITGFPAILGVQPGMAITGSGIPASTTVLSIALAYTAASVEADSHTNTTLDGITSTTGMFTGMIVTGPGVQTNTTIVKIVSANALLLSRPTTTTETNGTFVVAAPTTASSAGRYSGTQTATSPTITLGSTYGLWVGQDISGAGIPLGSTIISLVANTSITISQNATLTGSYQFSVAGAVIIMSANATASANTVSLSIAGGTVADPQWGAGDTQINNLPSVPVGVAQMGGRAYFVCGTNGIVFSDSGFPCQISNQPRVQALLTGDGLACTAIGPIMLASSLLGGIVQSLIVFEGGRKMQQISGDMTTNNLAMNALPVATGTLAPLTIATCEQGLSFVSPEGLRIVTHLGQVSQPIGDAGQGITVPFIYSLVPSRMCAAANAHFIRITTQNNNKADDPDEEYWYDLGRKSWCGPHSSTAALIQPWGHEFIMTFVGSTGRLSVSAVLPEANLYSYFEEGGYLIWEFMPTLLPDNDDMSMNAVIEMTFASGGPSCSETADEEPLLYTPVNPGDEPILPTDIPFCSLTEECGPPPPPPRIDLPDEPTRSTLLRPIRVTGISKDGVVLIGAGRNVAGGGQESQHWTRTWTEVNLGQHAMRLSRDGTIAVGFSSAVGPSWWTVSTAARTNIASAEHWALGISYDKTLMLGGKTVAGTATAKVWVRTTGVETALADVTSGLNYLITSPSQAAAINRANTMIVGSSRGVPCIWSWPGGAVTALAQDYAATLGGVRDYWEFGTSTGCTAIACSDDGRIIVGQAAGSGGEMRAVYWYGQGGINFLPLPAGDTASFAFDCSADGSVIVGCTGATVLGVPSPGTACVWINGEYLALPLPSGTQGPAPWAFSISGDGRTVGGGSGQYDNAPNETFATWWSLDPV